MVFHSIVMEAAWLEGFFISVFIVWRVPRVFKCEHQSEESLEYLSVNISQMTDSRSATKRIPERHIPTFHNWINVYMWEPATVEPWTCHACLFEYLPYLPSRFKSFIWEHTAKHSACAENSTRSAVAGRLMVRWFSAWWGRRLVKVAFLGFEFVIASP